MIFTSNPETINKLENERLRILHESKPINKEEIL